MSAKDGPVVIVGAGQAGGRAAKAMRDAGHGGSIILLGAEKYLPYERPTLSKAALMGTATPLPSLFEEDLYREYGIVVELGRKACAIDRKQRSVLLDGGRTIHYDQ